MTPREYFNDKGYVYLTGVLSRQDCAKLTQHMFTLFSEGKLVKDEQCPLSDSVYGDPTLDSVLAKLTKPLSDQLGIELLPTYTYARIYRTGEELKRHLDRPSCEISATITLGFSENSSLWPICFSKDPNDPVGTTVDIGVGDAIVYKGNELTHWRPKYKGEWQVQVFLHYVDANGKHKEFAFDKRPSLGVKPEVKKEAQKDPIKIPLIYNGVMIPSLDQECPGATSFHSKFKPELTFTPEECAKIVEFAKHKYPEKSRVGTETSGKYAPEVRRVQEYRIQLDENNKWIFDKIATAVSVANHEYFKFDLLGITHELQLLHYSSTEQSFYDWHTDVGTGHASTRKISVSIPLSPETNYEGGDLQINNYGNVINTNKEIGSINMFPSFLLHTVTPVTKGDRWVIVIWVHGSQRFK